MATAPLEVGSAIVGVVPLGVTLVTVIEPDGTRHSLMVERDGRFTWGPIRLSGVHHVEREDAPTKIVAVNLPPEESRLAAETDVQIGASKVLASTTKSSSFMQLWPWAIGAVLVVLLIEWRIYQRKVSGTRRAHTDSFGMLQ